MYKENRTISNEGDLLNSDKLLQTKQIYFYDCKKCVIYFSVALDVSLNELVINVWTYSDIVMARQAEFRPIFKSTEKTILLISTHIKT